VTLTLSLGFANNPRSRPVLDGRVKPEGIELQTTAVGMSELAWRQLGFKEFQVSELSMSSLLIALSHGDNTWVGLPIFTSRRFFHVGALAREDAGINGPADFAGKRIGVPEYQQTAALWARGILQHEFGLDPRDVHWYMERPPEKSHGGATGFDPAAIGIDLQYIPRDTDMGKMLQAGQLDGALHYLGSNTNLVDRSTTQFNPGSGVRPLFPDPEAEGIRYFEKTGIYPINHGAVVRRDVLEAHPWVALNLYSAFLEAKRLGTAEWKAGLAPSIDAGVLDAGAAAALDTDLFPYGVIANRNVLETLAEYSFEQGLTTRRMALEDIFYAPTLEL
jgi:4,5-dihydroxyphthalate decarboxylase